ncbi:hypothetical protein U1Q18_039513, partial [Sarracenia purpurea var. burkii]
MYRIENPTRQFGHERFCKMEFDCLTGAVEGLQQIHAGFGVYRLEQTGLEEEIVGKP